MPRPPPAPPPHAEDKVFLALLVALTIAFACVIGPYFSAVMWGAILALLFEPLYLRLLGRMRQRRTLAALATLAIILLMVILPLAFVAASLVQEATGLFQRVKSGELNFGVYFDQVVAALPSWATGLMDRVGLHDLTALQGKLNAAISARGQALASSALDAGQNALDLVVGFCVAMYLLFFLLRDGQALTRRIVAAVPLAPEHKGVLAARFATAIRATVKGNILVAAAQGALGGLAFWALGVHAPMLWAVVMAFLSLLPAVGAALIWGPVALYFLATGSVWQGLALLGYGVMVIGLVDNLLRPILVGKDMQLPDYVVLITTLGGLAVFGLNGFVIGPVIAAMFMAVWEIYAAGRRGKGDAPV
jgi:predicted PurR-regulated permease PerM